jgi:UDP-N-acetylglucosamine--N-acetylmuramyl-(pentapeptide) pyrophosphoryl-undecaprenol N-acetylglucosamine transferase
MKLMTTGGGTGGHVYPALSVIEALTQDPAWQTTRDDVAWVGRAGGIEEQIMAREGLRFVSVATGPLRGANPWQALRSLAQLARGIVQALGLIGQERPDAVLATGGYVSAPVIVAAWLRRRPCLIYLPDMEPGLTIKLLSRLAQRVAVTFESVAARFPNKAVVTGYPVRAALLCGERQAARAALGLGDDALVLLALGGSSGARTINQAVAASLQPLLALAQVVHACGQGDYEALAQRREALSSEQQARYHLHAYLHNMPDALLAADLVVARAGAATLGEFPAAGLPSILAPYPHSGQHQQPNADYLADHGAAVVIPDAELGARLLATAQGLLQSPTRLQVMRQAALRLARPGAARAIAQELVSLSTGESHA